MHSLNILRTFPFLASLVLLYSVINSRTLLAHEWTTYLADNQDTILTAIIISTIPIALLIAELRHPCLTFLAALQPMIIQAMFIATHPTLHLLFRPLLIALIIIPFLFLAFLLHPILEQNSQHRDDPNQREDERSSSTKT